MEFVHGKPVAPHFPLVHLAISDNDAGASAEHRTESDAAHGEHGENHGEAQQSQDGEHTGEKWDTEILHRNGCQVGNDEIQYQLRGLQLSHLALAHESNAQNNEQIENDGPYHADNHK